MRRKTWLVVLGSLFLLPTYVFAQKNEIGFVVGGTASIDNSQATALACTITNPTCNVHLKFQKGFALEGVLAHRLGGISLASFYLELPFVGIPSRNLLPVTANLPQSFSTLYFTPSLKLKLSGPGLSPFVTAGGGFARYSAGASGTTAAQTSTKAVLQAGAGLDIGTPLPLIGLRAEVREFFTGQPSFASTQHNIFFGGGIVLHF